MRPVALLDRDGTINVERNYLATVDEVVLLPNAAAGLRRMQELGVALVVVTNQSGIGRGYFDTGQLEAIHERLVELLAAEGVVLAGVYVCPHLPDAGCDCRKPAVGLVERAAADLGFAPSDAFVIGDKACDIEMGQAVGATTILAMTGYGRDELDGGAVWPDFVADDLLGASRVVEDVLDGRARVRRHLLASIETKRRVLELCETSIVRAAEVVAASLAAGGKLMICGNGGSAADAQHLAAEFVSVLDTRFVRPGLAAIALTTDTSFLTACSNDFGYAGIFERQVQALGRPGDVVLGISTSGSSENVVRALRYARDHGMDTIALTGARRAAMAEIAGTVVCVPSVKVQHIQESHLAIEHILTDLVEQALFGEGRLPG